MGYKKQIYTMRVCPKCESDHYGYEGWGSKPEELRDYYCENNHRFKEPKTIKVVKK